MASCPTYEPTFHGQLSSGDPNGSVNCSAWSASYAIAYATCGARKTTGTYIRAHSSEPRPDPMSPGLNLAQVATVAKSLGVYFSVRIGLRSVSWTEYEQRRADGQGCLLQVGYGALADSMYDAGNGFRGNHMIFESHNGTMDPLADGRRSGVWTYDGRVYSRAVVKQAASRLDTGGGSHPRRGYVWAAFTDDVVPDYRVRILPVAPATRRPFADYVVKGGAIVDGKTSTTTGMNRTCTAPAWFKDTRPGQGMLRRLVAYRSQTGTQHWVSAGWAIEV